MIHQGFIVRREVTPAITPAIRLAATEFMPMQVIGPVTIGKVGQNVAIKVYDPLAGEDVVFVFTLLWILLPIVSWIIAAIIWWWATSDLKFHTLSKLIGLLSPILGVAVEALVT